MEGIPTETIILKLKKILSMEFGGKKYGRYKISYKRMQQITGKMIINDSFFDLLSEHSLSKGITLINLGSEFVVIETGFLEGYRNVPQSIVEKLKNDTKHSI